MPVQPSPRALSIEESITLAITARANALKAEGKDIISLGAGEPDFPTPERVADAGVAAIRNHDTRYTAASGKPKVRAAAADWFQQFDLDYEPTEVMVTAGAKPALTMALMAITDPGDTVLVPAPFWASYPEIVKLVGGKPVVVEGHPDQGFIHTGAQIAAAAKDHGAKGVMLNYPNNPSGAVPTEAQIREIVDACVETDMWILSDEIYARLVYDGAKHVSPAAVPGGRDRTLVVNGGTKSHSMTGWRIGFLAGPAPVIKAAGGLQSQAIGNPSTISQAAVLEICAERDDAEFKRRLAAFGQRRSYLCEAIPQIPGLQLAPPQGAFYALVDVREVCDERGIDDVQLTEELLQEALVSVVPGSAFAMPGFLRLSYAASMKDLERVVERLQKFFGD